MTPEQAVAVATIPGACRLVPIHYGVWGIDEYVEVHDPLGRLRKAARGRPIAIQSTLPGQWVDFQVDAFASQVG